MSWITDIIISTSSIEFEGDEDARSYPAIAHINAWLGENGYGTLFMIKNPDPERYEPRDCWAGSYNKIPQEEFMAAILSAPWVVPEDVSIFWREEDRDWIMRRVSLKPIPMVVKQSSYVERGFDWSGPASAKEFREYLDRCAKRGIKLFDEWERDRNGNFVREAPPSDPAEIKERQAEFIRIVDSLVDKT